MIHNEPQCFRLFRTYFLVNYRRANFLNRLVNEIEDVLKIDIYLPPELEIEIKYLPEYYSRFFKGGYNYIEKKLYLYGNNWCRKTVLHELLHAASFFTNVAELQLIQKNQEHIVEGLTEFFTGYILFVKYKECYDNWINKKYVICTISYEKYVKLFGAITQVLISVRDLAKLYFYNPNLNWHKIYEEFKKRYSLRIFFEAKFPRFPNLRKEFINAIRVKLGDDEVERFEYLIDEASLNEVLDYSKIIR